MSPTHITIALLAGSLFLTGISARAEPTEPAEPQLGRLFLTPEWRKALERQRQLNIQQTRSLEGDTVRLDGVVVRSSGKSTVWINNQPQMESSRDAGVAAAPSRRQPGSVAVSTGGTAPIDLKVGTTLNQATGEQSGGLAGGEIRVRPARQP